MIVVIPAHLSKRNRAMTVIFRSILPHIYIFSISTMCTGAHLVSHISNTLSGCCF